jgi:hypothetical protein
MRDCSSKRVLVVRDGGEYSSASDFDENTLALLADYHAGNDNHPEEHIGTVLPLTSPEKVCVVSCSLEAFWSRYSVLKFA